MDMEIKVDRKRDKNNQIKINVPMYLPGMIYDTIVDFHGERFLVFVCSVNRSWRNVMPLLSRVWQNTAAKRMPGGGLRIIEEADIDTRLERDKNTSMKISAGSKTRKPHRTQRSRELHKWIWLRYKEIKKKRPNLNDAEIAEKIHHRLEELILDLEAEGYPTTPLLAVSTIKKILAQK